MLRLVCLLSLVYLVLCNPTPNNAVSSSPSGPHIAEVNILLPPKMTHPVEYRLRGSDGCFTWSWDHHDILSVIPEYNLSSYCSTSAHLKSIASYSGRKETAVYATDVHTGMVIRCKVYIDNFSRIQIFHNSIKLDLEGLATLRVRAFDDEDNEFSSLVGLRFMWNLRPETDGLPHHLVHVPLKDSPLSDCGGWCNDLNVRSRLEDSGEFSDLFVVKGTEIGHESVAVHLLEPFQEHMTDKITLTVAEAMSLDPPSPVFTLIGAVVHFTLKVIRGNIPQVVKLPSPYHEWSVLNSSVAQVDTRIGIAYALNLGVTTVSVEDTRVAGHLQMSSLHVVLPDTLSLYLLPLSVTIDHLEGVTSIPSAVRWYVISGRQYLVHMKVFTRGPGAQEIYLTETDNIKLHEDQSEYWDTSSLSSDSFPKSHGWWNSRILKATSTGVGKLTATLTYSRGHDETKEVLKVTQEVMVCDQVKFAIDKKSASQDILLPWAPGVYQEVELEVTGGCGSLFSDYKWFSSDMATVSVSASGIVQAKRPGKATVKVVSIYDPFNSDEVVVEVSIPSSLTMLPNYPVETMVGRHIPAAVTMQALNGAYFYKCDAFNSLIRWKTGSESFLIVNATMQSLVLDEQVDRASFYGPPCSWTLIYASSSGRTLLHATLTKEYHDYDHSAGGSIGLKSSSYIAAYFPLIVRQAGDGNQFGGYWFDLAQAETLDQVENLNSLYLAPGTHMDVMLLGGPEPWDEEIEYVKTVRILNEEDQHVEDAANINQMDEGYGTQYRVSCLQVGTFKVIFKRGNLVGTDHPHPAVVVVQMLLRCSYPSSIVLIADETVNSPAVIKSEIQARRGSGHIRAVPVTVANGRSIRVSAVGISNSGQAFGNSSSLHLRWEISNCDGLAVWDDAYTSGSVKSTWERFLALQNSSGLCTVRATIIEFLENSGDLTDAIPLQIVSTLRVTPQFNLMFFSPDAKLNLSVSGGSCFLNSVVNDTRTVEVISAPADLQCSQLVLVPKRLGTTLVTVHDMGLSPPLSASSVVQVADVEWIKITSGDEISFMEGGLQSINLLAGIDDGSTFDSSQYMYMNICVHIEDDVVELVDSEYVKSPNFVIQARRVGMTTLYLSARQQSGHDIMSQPVNIEVYAPPSMHPSDIFLVPGASYVLNVDGGPTIGARVEYASMDAETAVIDNSSGHLSAIAPGNTTLVARFYRNGDETICHAYGKVTVGVPSTVMLDVQSKQLAVGRKMPIFPSFSLGNLFSFYELCKNYEWYIDDTDVLSFLVADRSDGHQELGFIQVLYGKSAGRTDVSVSFSCDFISGSFSHSRLYTASVSLGVVSDLPLALGVPMTWILPPHYTTSNLLPTSSSLLNKGDAHGQKGSIKYSLLKESCGKDEGGENDGISIEGGKIKTRDSNHIACIQAKDRVTGRTAVASCVSVAEVSQIRINSGLSIRAVNLAVGSELDLPVSYCDDLGNPFHEVYNVTFVKAETNYRHVILIDDGKEKIHLKAMRHGRALLQASLSSNPEKSDYILISVGAHLYPENPIIGLGSRVNFSVQDLDDQVSGRWLSANTSVLSIDIPSGKAKATGEGTTQVIFEGSSFKIQTGVTVLKGNVVTVDAPEGTLTNAPFPAKGYSFPVRFGDTYTSYDCKVDPPFVGYAKPWRDLATGSSYCLFFPYTPEHLVLSLPKSKDMRQDVSVTMTASVKGASHSSGSASARFVGGFSILGIDQSSLQLLLTPESNKSVLTIVGNTDAEVQWQDRDLLMITPILREENGIGGRAQYEVRVVRPERFAKKITFSLLGNGQQVEIEVKYETGEGARASAKINRITLWAGILGSLTLLALTVAAFIWYLDRPERSQTITTSRSSHFVTAPVTPEHGIAAVVSERSSPRTPQPFVDYLRRTIDETPYYRTEARRRFNPQNTF